MTILQGKKGLIMGVANKMSIAWGIASQAKKYGAELAFTYQGDALKKRVEPLAESVGSDIILPCDVTDQASIDAVFAELEKKWGKLDFVVHAIAYSNKEELKGRFINTTLDNFLNTMNISAYSLVAVTKAAEPLMTKSGGGSILTLSYYGAEKVVPHYNVMGVAKAALEACVRYLAVDVSNIKVNAISAGPIKTLAASGIGDFRYIGKWHENNSPLKRNTNQDEVGGGAVYLLSDLGDGVTGEVLHIDSGYHVVGMKDPYSPDMSLTKGEE
ncbi:MAG: SDR family oxidoreductase [Proteobacteria bacterium]|nr:SDR family oxidoreductase [Pseudomonadota bacterium]